jgi:hypothetical protein
MIEQRKIDYKDKAYRELCYRTASNPKDPIPTQAFEDLMLFAESFGLDPAARHVTILSNRSRDRQGNWVTTWRNLTQIDGMRSVAQRTGEYLGSSAPTFTYKPDGSLESATVIVKRWNPQAQQVGEYGYTAFFDEFAGRDRQGEVTSTWATKGHVMLAKCAESNALRKAFDLGAMLTPEEMDQTNNPVVIQPTGDRKLQGTTVSAEILTQVEDVQPEEVAQPSLKDRWTPENTDSARQAFKDFLGRLGKEHVSPAALSDYIAKKIGQPCAEAQKSNPGAIIAAIREDWPYDPGVVRPGVLLAHHETNETIQAKGADQAAAELPQPQPVAKPPATTYFFELAKLSGRLKPRLENGEVVKKYLLSQLPEGTKLSEVKTDPNIVHSLVAMNALSDQDLEQLLFKAA